MSQQHRTIIKDDASLEGKLNNLEIAKESSTGETPVENTLASDVATKSAVLAAAKDHKFWSTQPVPQYKEPSMMQITDTGKLPEGAILPEKVCRALVKQPEPLLAGFEWCEIDLLSPGEITELYELLDLHYVEDSDGSFRFNYSAEFLKWALMPPGWKKEWHIGVRTKASNEGKPGKLVAFISAVPANLQIRDLQLSTVEINFLTVHRKLRNKRLAPVLIKEITRRCYKVGIFQALYTAGTLLPTPVSTCRYFHRSLDWAHLHKVGFSHIPLNSSKARQELKYRLETSVSLPGIRPMKSEDIGKVSALLARYNRRFQLRQSFSEPEIAHYLCSEASKSVVSAYVVEQNGEITDLVSFYLLEVSNQMNLAISVQQADVSQSTVLRSTKSEKIRAAYLYYYASDTGDTIDDDEVHVLASKELSLQKRLQDLVHDALVLAKQAKFHVFNALTLQDNPLFLAEQKFEPGDGKLHYYLFNWRTPQLPGGIDDLGRIDKGKTKGVGIVML